MVKKIVKKKKQLASGVSPKTNKLKSDVRDREIEKSRKQEEQQGVMQNEKLMVTEYQIREQRLKPTCAMFAESSRKKYERDRKYRDELDWEHFIKCDGTPNPQVVQELNTYLFVCRQICHTDDVRNSYVDKCLEIFNIMDAVDDIVDLPLDFNRFKIQCFREASDNLGRLMVEIVYGACYSLLSDYDHRMDPVDLETVAYQNSCDAFTVGLHVVCHRPRLRTDDRPPPKCDFPECLVTVNVPTQLSQQHMAVMALWLHWDPFTDRISEFDVSESPESDTRDLWQYSVDAWEERELTMRRLIAEKEQVRKTKMEEKLKKFSKYPDDHNAEQEGDDSATNSIKNVHTDQLKQRLEQVHDDKVVNKDESQKLFESAQSVGAVFEKRQSEQMETISNSLNYQEKPNELNPRRYWIIGGAFNVEMWELPMQPVELEDGTVGVMIIGPSALHPVDFHEKYEPIQRPKGYLFSYLADEETDVNQQNQEALKRLALISIKLPENVLWFENPKPAIWNEEKKIWMTDYIYDISFNEEEQTVSFRAGRMGSFGLAVDRYSNFPFQWWELRPADDGDGVVLSVTAAKVLVEFVVRGHLAAIALLQNATTAAALQETVGTYHRPDKLVRLLRRGGVNLFPEPDAYHYVAGYRPPKHAVAERHAYRCMAVLSGTHRFAASRWNVHVAADRMVLQMKEIPPATGDGDSGRGVDGSVGDPEDESAGDGASSSVPYRTVMVTPERSVQLKCDEDSHTFSEQAVKNAPYSPDLWALATDVAVHAEVDRAAVDFVTAETLFYLMDKIKFLSYS